MEKVLENITNLVHRIDELPYPPQVGMVTSQVECAGSDSIAIELPMMGAFMRLRQKINLRLIEEGRGDYLRDYAEAQHYYANVRAVLLFILDAIDHQATTQEQQPRLGQRIALDLEKLLTDVRSLLDKLYILAIRYSCEKDLAVLSLSARAPARKSFGAFADRMDDSRRENDGQDSVERCQHEFDEPLCFFRDLLPWGQTIRSLRDRYVHHSLESFVFFVGDRVCIDLDWKGRMRPVAMRRAMPESFYLEGNPNPLIVLDRFLVYLIAPILALDQTFGDFLNKLPDYRFGDGPQPSSYEVNPRLFKLLNENQSVLKPEIFQSRYSALIVMAAPQES